ncbi:MAG: transcriptional regulator NrdR [Patescibacteria group bacterium]
MRCSQCQSEETKVVESRDVAEGVAIRRRRECLDCHFRFTTYERVEQPQVIIIKNDGNRELFSREKLLSGLRKACDKTPVTTAQLELLVEDVEKQLYTKNEQELPSSIIGDLVMDRLAALNEVAYVRFASVYRKFRDIGGFERELTRMRGKKTG